MPVEYLRSPAKHTALSALLMKMGKKRLVKKSPAAIRRIFLEGRLKVETFRHRKGVKQKRNKHAHAHFTPL
jgi:hypothetical protein